MPCKAHRYLLKAHHYLLVLSALLLPSLIGITGTVQYTPSLAVRDSHPWPFKGGGVGGSSHAGHQIGRTNRSLAFSVATAASSLMASGRNVEDCVECSGSGTGFK